MRLLQCSTFCKAVERTGTNKNERKTTTFHQQRLMQQIVHNKASPVRPSNDGPSNTGTLRFSPTQLNPIPRHGGRLETEIKWNLIYPTPDRTGAAIICLLFQRGMQKSLLRVGFGCTLVVCPGFGTISAFFAFNAPLVLLRLPFSFLNFISLHFAVSLARAKSGKKVMLKEKRSTSARYWLWLCVQWAKLRGRIH